MTGKSFGLCSQTYKPDSDLFSTSRRTGVPLSTRSDIRPVCSKRLKRSYTKPKNFIARKASEDSTSSTASELDNARNFFGKGLIIPVQFAN